MAVAQLPAALKAHPTAQYVRRPSTAHSAVCMYLGAYINDLCQHLRTYTWAVQRQPKILGFPAVSFLTHCAQLLQLNPGALLESFFTQLYLQHFISCVMDTDQLCY